MLDTLINVFPFAFIAYLIYINRNKLSRTLKSMNFMKLIGLLLSYLVVIIAVASLLYFGARPLVNSIAAGNQILQTILAIVIILIVLAPTQYLIHKITQRFTNKKSN